MLSSRSVTTVTDTDSVGCSETLEVVSLHDSLESFPDSTNCARSGTALSRDRVMDVRGCLYINVLPGHKVSSRELGPCETREFVRSYFLERFWFDAPGSTTASSVTGNSTTLILGSMPAWLNWPMRAEETFFARLGVQPTMTEWCGGIVEVEGYELEERTSTLSSCRRASRGQLRGTGEDEVLDLREGR